MKEETMNLAYLETLSFSDLVKLADEFGVDVPDDLDRRFLIAELLELSEESKKNDEEMVISPVQTMEGNPEISLKANFNETQISCVLRNPAWLFVFWSISERELKAIKAEGSSIKLRICSLQSPTDQVPVEAFEIQASSDSFEQYVLLPNGAKFVKVELISVAGATGKVLAFSQVVVIPQGSSLLNDWQIGSNADFAPIIKLSGMNKILSDNYKYHRHSFS